MGKKFETEDIFGGFFFGGAAKRDLELHWANEICPRLLAAKKKKLATRLVNRRQYRNVGKGACHVAGAAAPARGCLPRVHYYC